MFRFWECFPILMKLFQLQISTLKKSQFENVPVKGRSLRGSPSLRIFKFWEFECIKKQQPHAGIYVIASKIEICKTIMFRFWGCCSSLKMFFQFKISILRESQFKNVQVLGGCSTLRSSQFEKVPVSKAVPVSGCPLRRSPSLRMFKFWEFKGFMKQQPGSGIVSYSFHQRGLRNCRQTRLSEAWMSSKKGCRSNVLQQSQIYVCTIGVSCVKNVLFTYYFHVLIRNDTSM